MDFGGYFAQAVAGVCLGTVCGVHDQLWQKNELNGTAEERVQNFERHAGFDALRDGFDYPAALSRELQGIEPAKRLKGRDNSSSIMRAFFPKFFTRRIVALTAAVVMLAAPVAAQQRTRKPAPKPAAKPAASEPAGKPCPFSRPNDPSHRLVLRDGNYQMVSKCELIGDRVHYMSAERYDWEDIPTSLVDWDATQKFELRMVAPQRSAEAAAVDAEEAAERKREEAKTPEIRPGLRLPSQGGVFLLASEHSY